MLNYG